MWSIHILSILNMIAKFYKMIYNNHGDEKLEA